LAAEVAGYESTTQPKEEQMLSTPTKTPIRPAVAEIAPETAEATYVGEWTPLGRAVVVEEDGRRRPLRMRDSAQIGGYAWGRAGSVPREVARAILTDATGNPMLAERLCRPLTWEVVSELPAGGFRLTKSEVLDWVAAQA
jgi:hypothetical protein